MGFYLVTSLAGLASDFLLIEVDLEMNGLGVFLILEWPAWPGNADTATSLFTDKPIKMILFDYISPRSSPLSDLLRELPCPQLKLVRVFNVCHSLIPSNTNTPIVLKTEVKSAVLLIGRASRQKRSHDVELQTEAAQGTKGKGTTGNQTEKVKRRVQKPLLQWRSIFRGPVLKTTKTTW
jgi:hypothetical protein